MALFGNLLNNIKTLFTAPGNYERAIQARGRGESIAGLSRPTRTTTSQLVKDYRDRQAQAAYTPSQSYSVPQQTSASVIPDKSLDQYLAETGRQGVLDELGRTGQLAQARAEFARGQGEFASDFAMRGAGQSPDQAADLLLNQVDDWNSKIAQYEKENPFAYDEAQLRASAEERLNPYYEAELGDFVEGVENQRNRSAEDEKNVITELTARAETLTGRIRRKLSQALEASKEGFAGANLFFSGRRLREGGEMKVESADQMADIDREKRLGIEDTQLKRRRLLEDLGLRERTFNRQLGAEKETALTTDVERQKKDAYTQYYGQMQESLGIPGLKYLDI